MAKKAGNYPLPNHSQNHNHAAPRDSEVEELLRKAEVLLKENEPRKALDLISRSRIHSPWVTNALGVCQLRLGQAKIAVEAFRGLVLGAGGIQLRSDVPPVFKANFAVALLKADNMDGFLSTVAELSAEEHPAATRLKTAIEGWKKSLTMWQRLNWYLGGLPATPLTLDFPLGDLT
ncbi:MAG TPA: hypothetical protein PKD86_03705 [Gemmatales bacterium]|nr:hypothetical protein [Gemmatales bacterium]HMP58439.1 hypothetical protein [Gemmatales bacterium]